MMYTWWWSCAACRFGTNSTWRLGVCPRCDQHMEGELIPLATDTLLAAELDVGLEQAHARHIDGWMSSKSTAMIRKRWPKQKRT